MNKFFFMFVVIFFVLVMGVSAYPDQICYPLSTGTVCINTTTITGVSILTNSTTPGSCSAGYVVQNTTSGGVQCVALNSSSEVDPIWSANASRVTALETSNTTISANINILNTSVILNTANAATLNTTINLNYNNIQAVNDSIPSSGDTYWSINHSELENQSGILGVNQTYITNYGYITKGVANAWEIVEANITDFGSYLTSESDPVWSGNASRVAALETSNTTTNANIGVLNTTSVKTTGYNSMQGEYVYRDSFSSPIMNFSSAFGGVTLGTGSASAGSLLISLGVLNVTSAIVTFTNGATSLSNFNVTKNVTANHFYWQNGSEILPGSSSEVDPIWSANASRVTALETSNTTISANINILNTSVILNTANAATLNTTINLNYNNIQAENTTINLNYNNIQAVNDSIPDTSAYLQNGTTINETIYYFTNGGNITSNATHIIIG